MVGACMYKRSELEKTFAFHAQNLGVPPWEEEYMFAWKSMERKWRFDFAWPEQKVAVECDGGTWSRGRHTRGAGYAGDCEKRNAAQILGWRVLHYTSDMLESDPGGVMDQVKWVLEKSDANSAASGAANCEEGCDGSGE